MRAGSDLLAVSATGEFSLENSKRAFLELMRAVALHNTKRVLFDGRTIMGKVRTIDRFYYGKFAADAVAQHQRRSGSGTIRFAYVLTEPMLDPERFDKTVAVNRGMEVMAFDDLGEALQWLSSANKPGTAEGI